MEKEPAQQFMGKESFDDEASASRVRLPRPFTGRPRCSAAKFGDECQAASANG